MRALGDFFRFLRGQDDGIKRRTVRAGLWVGASSVLWNMLSLFRSIILARLLTPEIFGLWAICMTLNRGLNVFSETGFASALIQRQERAEEARDTAFTLLIIRGAVLCIVTIVAAPFFAAFYDQPILQPLVSVMAMAFFISGFHNINTILHQKELRYQRLALLDQSSMVLGFVFVVAVAYYYRSPWALVASHIFTATITVALSYLIIPSKPRLAFDRTLARELFHYGKFVSGAAMVAFVTLEIDNVVIGKLVSMEALGFYAVAYMLANLPATQLAKVVSGVMLPAYSKLQSDTPALRAAYQRTLEFVSMFAIPAAAGLGALAPQVVGVIYGERWLPAVEALRILAVFGCLRSIGVLSGYLYNATGRPRISFYFTLVKLAVIAVLIYPLTVGYGIAGTAMAITAPSLLTFFADFIVLRRIIGLDPQAALRPLLRTVLYSALMAGVLLALQKYIGHIDLLSLLASVGLGFLIYLVLVWRDLRRMYAWITSRK
jgi:O-antigen/teichoic acid export membrane protein